MEIDLPPLDSDAFTHPAQEYVAFLDILGFGALVVENWQKARQTLGIVAMQIEVIEPAARQFVAHCKPKPPGTVVRVEGLSDSIILSGTDFYDVAYIAQQFQVGAILASRLLRGCIAKGEHAQAKTARSTFFLSKALVLAVQGEARANYPRVIIDSSVPPEDVWSPDEPLSRRLLLQDADGVWMVNPFFLGSEAWCKPKLDEMVSEYARTKHAAKYHWIRSLYGRVHGT